MDHFGLAETLSAFFDRELAICLREKSVEVEGGNNWPAFTRETVRPSLASIGNFDGMEEVKNQGKGECGWKMNNQ
jgi:hypothetical protein